MTKAETNYKAKRTLVIGLSTIVYFFSHVTLSTALARDTVNNSVLLFNVE